MRAWASTVTIVVLLSTVTVLQAVRERVLPDVVMAPEHLLYVRSPQVLTRAALGFDALLADVYWLRTVQHYGSTKRSTDPNKKYDLLFPLLDLTTSLDPRFRAAYRFGAIFLAEPFPGGPGRPDHAISLLEKGLRAKPDAWELAQDVGFVHYWWLQDYAAAGEWFSRAAKMPDAPNWLGAVAAVTLAQGGNRESSRRLWQEVGRNAEAEWLTRAAEQRLHQLDAMDQIDQLNAIIQAYTSRSGRVPSQWGELGAAGLLRSVPLDPAGVPYALTTRGAALDPASPLNPLPTEQGAAPPALSMGDGKPVASSRQP